MTACSGAPAAHEDYLVPVVYGALVIKVPIAEYARQQAGYVDDCAVRVGIHTDEVVVGELGSAEYRAIRDAVNLAARLRRVPAPRRLNPDSTLR